MHLFSPKEALDLCPVLDLKNVEAVAYIPSDGQIDPSSLTSALIKGARDNEVQVFEGDECTIISAEFNKISNPAVNRITVESLVLKGTDENGFRRKLKVGIVVNCGGLWAREVGKILETDVPTINVEH
jgi:sarcosine dehydrogenase